MEHKLKSLLEILEDDKKKKDKEKVDKKEEKKELSKHDKVFPCEKKDSSYFNYIKPKYLVEDFMKHWVPSDNQTYNVLTYFDYISSEAKNGTETIELYTYLCRFAMYCINNNTGKERKPDLDLIKKLIKKGADVNFVDNYSKNDTCLQKAIESRNEDVIRLLLKYGANPNVERPELTDSPVLSIFSIVASKESVLGNADFLHIFRDMVEKYDADIYNKDSNGKYVFVNLVNDLEPKDKLYAKAILQRYGFKEEDYEEDDIENQDSENEDSENEESKKMEILQKYFEYMKSLGGDFVYSGDMTNVLNTLEILIKDKEKTSKSDDKNETKKSDNDFDDTFKIPEDLL